MSCGDGGVTAAQEGISGAVEGDNFKKSDEASVEEKRQLQADIVSEDASKKEPLAIPQPGNKGGDAVSTDSTGEDMVNNINKEEASGGEIDNITNTGNNLEDSRKAEEGTEDTSTQELPVITQTGNECGDEGAVSKNNADKEPADDTGKGEASESDSMETDVMNTGNEDGKEEKEGIKESTVSESNGGDSKEEHTHSEGKGDEQKKEEEKKEEGGVIVADSDYHKNDVEMGSQSSGDTEPVASEGEEEVKNKEKKPDRVDSTGESSGTKQKTKKDSGSKAEKDSGSGEDDGEWERPWMSYSGWGRPKKITLPRISRYSSYDTEQYRQGYPGKEDDHSINHNYEFYTNERSSFPQGDLVDNIHENWWGNYRLLEYHHSYIQWLFPIRESGLNWHAKELQPHEIKQICDDPKALDRVVKSYEMMLDFYGLKLVDRSTGEVKRSQNWFERFDNLNYSGHNNLRITRILKCLGEFGFESFKVPLIRCFLHEAIIEGTLRNTLSSCLNYWVEVVKDDKEREELHQYAKELVDKANQENKQS